MNLTPKQIATQEAMLLRLYPGKSLQEAKKQEPILWLIVSVVEPHWPVYGTIVHYEETKYFTEYTIVWSDKEIEKVMNRNMNNYNIIWLPPTLPRVLDALRSHSIRRCDYLWEKYDCVYIRRSMHWVIWENIERKLRNDDGTDAILRDQDIQTQDSVSSLLGVE